jgi:hypothetical protein
MLVIFLYENVMGSSAVYRIRPPFIAADFKFYTQEKLPPTDSRLRTDHRCLENVEYAKAKEEKLRLKQRQLHVNTAMK